MLRAVNTSRLTSPLMPTQHGSARAGVACRQLSPPAHHSCLCVLHCHKSVPASVACGYEVCYTTALKECFISHCRVQLLAEAPHLSQTLSSRAYVERNRHDSDPSGNSKGDGHLTILCMSMLGSDNCCPQPSQQKLCKNCKQLTM